MITSHPADARYFGSRAGARQAVRDSEKVIRLGYFAAGSFGVYPPLKDNGQYVGQLAGGQPPSVCVWMTTGARS